MPIFENFEGIHPFLDGNGRVGRLLIPLFLVERGILPTPLLHISAFFDATRRDYYDRLAAVSHEAAWGDWLEYFLDGAARMSADAFRRAERISGLLADWRARVAAIASRTPSLLVDLLAENPFWTIKRAAGRLGVAYTTAQRAVEKLLALGVLQQVGDARRGRVYCATQLMAILDEPARISG